ATLRAPAPVERRPAAAPEIEQAVALLTASRSPVIFAGGGVHLAGAHDALRAVAEHLQAAVIMTAEGKGALSDANDLSLGAALWPGSPARLYLDQADVVLAVGTRLATVPLQPTQRVLPIDTDPEGNGRNHAPPPRRGGAARGGEGGGAWPSAAAPPVLRGRRAAPSGRPCGQRRWPPTTRSRRPRSSGASGPGHRATPSWLAT